MKMTAVCDSTFHVPFGLATSGSMNMTTVYIGNCLFVLSKLLLYIQTLFKINVEYIQESYPSSRECSLPCVVLVR